MPHISMFFKISMYLRERRVGFWGDLVCAIIYIDSNRWEAGTEYFTSRDLRCERMTSSLDGRVGHLWCSKCRWFRLTHVGHVTCRQGSRSRRDSRGRECVHEESCSLGVGRCRRRNVAEAVEAYAWKKISKQINKHQWYSF